MGYCTIKNVWCEGACEVSTLDQRTGEELKFTMCYAGREGKPHPYHWLNNKNCSNTE